VRGGNPVDVLDTRLEVIVRGLETARAFGAFDCASEERLGSLVGQIP